MTKCEIQRIEVLDIGTFTVITKPLKFLFNQRGLWSWGVCFLFLLIPLQTAHAQLLDSYTENFDDRTEDTSINGVNLWSVTQGDPMQAMIDTAVTPSGAGKSLKLVGALTNVHLGRPMNYGNLSPTWIRFRVRPAVAAENPEVPETGIAAVCMDHTGKVMASDGATWLDTGKSYESGRWYNVALKLNFSNHTYDVYVTDTVNPDSDFTPVKTGLHFIDPSINAVSDIHFNGSYSTTTDDDSYIDDISVTFFDRLEFTSSSQKLLLGEVSGPIGIQLQSANSAPQTAIADMSLELHTSSAGGKFSLDPDNWQDILSLILPQGAQAVTIYYKDISPGKPIISVSEFPDAGVTDALQSEEIVNTVASFKVEPAGPFVAGQDFVLSLTARQEDGTPDANYSGTVDLRAEYVSPAQGTMSLSLASGSGFVNGALDLVLSYPDCGEIMIVVNDEEEVNKIGYSPQIKFVPAGFTVEAAAVQTIGKLFPLTIRARNVAGAVTPNYAESVNLSVVPVSPAAMTNPQLSLSSVAGTRFSGGIAEPEVFFDLAGTIKIKAAAAMDASKQGTSGELTFVPKGISAVVSEPPGERGFFYLGEAIKLEVMLVGETGEAVANFNGLVEFSGPVSLGLPDDYNFTEKDAGMHTFTLRPTQSGTFSVTVSTADGSLIGETQRFLIKNAIIQVVDNTSPVGTGEVEIQIVDEDGNLISSENDLTVNVDIEEELGNGSAYLSSGQVKLKNGRGLLSITDSEAEIVTINPTVPGGKIKSKRGTLTFGRVGKSGVNFQIWREIKDKK